MTNPLVDIEPFYQPIVIYRYNEEGGATDCSEVVGLEVLARKKESDGYRCPYAFIDGISKDVTSLNDLTYSLLRMSLDFFGGQDLLRSRGASPQIYLSVNVSPSQVCSFSFVDIIAEYSLAFSHLCNMSLVLEITETEGVNDVERMQYALAELSEQGVRLYLDDYGKYYSTPYAISMVKPSCIKIDRHFISEMFRCPIALKFIEQTIDMAGVIGAGVIAEGVESKMQAEKLYQLGINLMQGFAFYHPVGRDRVRTVLRKSYGDKKK